MKPAARLFIPALLAVAVGLLTACGKNGAQSPGTGGDAAGKEDAVASVEGEVYYRERMLLPPGAEVEVQLQDISRADAPASIMATVMFKPDTAPPWPFSISYKPAQIDQRMRYALRATVSREGQLLFTSTEYIDPFAGNPVKVLVQRVAEPVSQAPVARTGAADAGGDTGAGAAGSGDVAVTWILETLDGEPAPAGAGGRPIDLALNQGEHSVAGFGGCNRYRGGFTSDGHSSHGTPIAFGDLASTMMACAEGGEAEQAYLKMLGRVDAYRMEGEALALLAGDRTVATFKQK